MSEEQAAEETQDVQAPETAEETPQAAPEAEAAPEPNSPWANDLEAFEDPNVRAKVDEFMRAKVQPYVSKLEAESAPNRNAARLWEAFQDDPYTTHEQVTREIYGDKADAVLRALEGDDAEVEVDYSDTDVDDPESSDDTPDLSNLPPDVRDFIESQMEEKQEAEYREALAEIGKSFEEKGIPFDPEIYEPHLIAAEGDVDAASESYEKWVTKAKDTFGLKVPTEGIEREPAPPTLGGSNSSSGGQAPPQEKEYGSIGEALDDFFAEESSPPPTV